MRTMDLRIPRLLADAMKTKLKELGLEVEGSRFSSDVMFQPGSMTREGVESFVEYLGTCGLDGIKVLRAELRKYLKVADEGPDGVTARSVTQATWLLEQLVARLPHHLLFSRDTYEGRSYAGYFVADIHYQPEHEGTGRRDYSPEMCIVRLVCIENDERVGTKLHLESADVYGLTPLEMLAKAGFFPETPALLQNLEGETARYYEVVKQIGKKFVATGIGIADLDDAMQQQESRWGSWSRERVRMDNFGVECHVVVDVLNEKDSSNDEHHSRMSDSDSRVDLYRWHRRRTRLFSPGEDEIARHLEADEDTEDPPEDMQIPVHPLVPVFDLRRHCRMRVHVNNLRPYAYRKEVAAGLFLPERDWCMVNMLVDRSGDVFRDVVTGKGSSVNVLSEGPPGTGKTVTAEVFAEFKERPLYTVQCAQLGLDPERVENNLGVILQRANRWNAVLLLDEADVYIRKRGNDLAQNAIVGVFLRVLEYATAILFLTTNLGHDVDDAVASRCIVRLRYGPPGPENLAKILENLAVLNAIRLGEGVARRFSDRHPQLSGRDAKNLLKLAVFAARENRSLTVEDLEFALQFKPTESMEPPMMTIQVGNGPPVPVNLLDRSVGQSVSVPVFSPPPPPPR